MKFPRAAKFTISMDTVKNDPDLVLEVLSGVLILRAECDAAGDVMEYVGSHPAFPIRAEYAAPTFVHPLFFQAREGEGVEQWTVTRFAGWERSLGNAA